MHNIPNGNRRFNLKAAESWTPHPERDARKFRKVQLSVHRHDLNGAGIEAVRSKLLRLHRMSTGFDGNGSTHRLKQAIGLAPVPVEFTPQPRTAADQYSSHPETDPPTIEQARAAMRALRNERRAERQLEHDDDFELRDAELRCDALLDELDAKYQRTVSL